MHEVETKVLNVDLEQVSKPLNAEGAKKIADAKYSIDWYRPVGQKEGEEAWYLRIRSSSASRPEVTWKGKADTLGVSRKVEEINFFIDDAEKLASLFEKLGLEKYAHQEKFRTSWALQGWRFDLDQYPKMPAYLEIEGIDENHIQEAIRMLGLQNHKTNSSGERILIQTEYRLDWYDMRF
ncbi:MAG: CYTH domain-containing protein [Patescibacteria group bacterium]